MDYTDEQLTAVNAAIAEHPYPRYTYPAANAIDEASRATRYARTVALLLLTKRAPSEDSTR